MKPSFIVAVLFHLKKINNICISKIYYVKCIAYAKMLMCYIKKFWFWEAILVTNVDLKKIEEAVKMILEAVGEDPAREGLLDTPKRVSQNVRGNVRRS